MRSFFHIDFSQVLYLYFKLSLNHIALCCFLGLKEMSENLTEKYCQDVIHFSTDICLTVYRASYYRIYKIQDSYMKQTVFVYTQRFPQINRHHIEDLNQSRPSPVPFPHFHFD